MDLREVDDFEGHLEVTVWPGDEFRLDELSRFGADLNVDQGLIRDQRGFDTTLALANALHGLDRCGREHHVRDAENRDSTQHFEQGETVMPVRPQASNHELTRGEYGRSPGSARCREWPQNHPDR